MNYLMDRHLTDHRWAEGYSPDREPLAFDVGDKVRVDQPDSPHHGRAGVVACAYEDLRDDAAIVFYGVNLDDGVDDFQASELVRRAD